jgi:ABC-2 type transport system permease protein
VIGTIALRELRSLFLSPLAWIILGVIQAILGFSFFSSVTQFLQHPDSRGVTAAVAVPVFGWAAVLLLFVSPLITMRLVSEERRNQTLALLYSAPASMVEIVLGKYLGVMAYLLLVVAMLVLMPLSLLFGGTLDWGLLLTSALGLILLLASFAAIGLFMSTLTQSPTLAAVASFGALFLLWIFDASVNLWGENFLSYLSIIDHYLPFMQGLFNSEDTLYYLIFSAVFLIFSVRRLDADRLGA